MEEEKPNCTEVLEVINTYFIISLFTKSLLYIIKNTSNSSFSSFFFDEKLQTYLLSALYHIKTIQYPYP